MSIIKIRDANGNVQEVLAIRGEDGKNYVLTDADKQEIADMIVSENWGSGIVVDRHNLYDYLDFVTSHHFPEEEFYWEKYLDGTAKIFFRGKKQTQYGTSEDMNLEIAMPYALADMNITVSNFVLDDRSSVSCLYKEVIVDTDGREWRKGLEVTIIFNNPDGAAVNVANIVDFEIVVTGRWK